MKMFASPRALTLAVVAAMTLALPMLGGCNQKAGSADAAKSGSGKSDRGQTGAKQDNDDQSHGDQGSNIAQDQMPESEAGPKKMLMAIEALQDQFDEGMSQEQFVEAAKQTQPKAVALADKLLALNPPEEIRVKAMLAKFQALAILRNVGDTAAKEDLKKLLGTMSTDADPSLAMTAQLTLLRLRIGEINGDEAAAMAVAADIEKTFATIKADDSKQRLWSDLAMESERMDLFEPARIAFKALAEMGQGDSLVAEEAARVGALGLKRLSLVGQPMVLKGNKLDGTEFDIAEYRGKVVLVDFWATWCPACIQEMPHLAELYNKYRDQGFEVVGVSNDDTPAEALEFLEQNKLPWEQLFNGEPGAAGTLGEKLGVRALPTTFLVDRQGKVVSLAAYGDQTEKLLEKYLAQPAAEPPAAK